MKGSPIYAEKSAGVTESGWTPPTNCASLFRIQLTKSLKCSWMKFRAWWRHEDGFRRHSPAQFTFKQGETAMGDKGKKDKGKREQQKKAQLTPKEKRKLKKEKQK
ncbi:MAG: hypothetical protein JRF64_03410 [Deltaproteobacteria bacterium]|jgi:hypothetical protein|nr:hypothetical protein [Deltaproteobacteria bacterium]